MARFGMVIDTRLCIGCQDCVAACNAENGVPPGERRVRVRTDAKGTFPKVVVTFFSERCNHCDKPACVTVCPTGASHVAEPGRTVQIDAEKCIGCALCVPACPYGARFMNERNEGKADKCDFCAHRVKEGKEPACAAVCPMRAIAFGDLDDPKSRASALLASRKHMVLKPERGTGPRVHYLI